MKYPMVEGIKTTCAWRGRAFSVGCAPARPASHVHTNVNKRTKKGTKDKAPRQ